VFPSSHKPIAVDDEKATGHLRQFDIPAAGDLSCVFTEPTAQGSIQGFASVNDAPMPIESINAFLWWGYILSERMGGARLELLDELMCERLVELKEELMSVAHGRRILARAPWWKKEFYACCF
jgi:hypothetical protein